MGISSQAYYRRNQAFDARVCQGQAVVYFVLEKRRRQSRLGTRELYYLMSAEASAPLCLGRECLFAILWEARALIPRKRAYHKAMDSHHRFRRHPNLLKAGLGQIVTSGPGQVFLGGGLTYRTPGQRSPPAWGGRCLRMFGMQCSWSEPALTLLRENVSRSGGDRTSLPPLR